MQQAVLKYSKPMRIMHWTMAVIILCMITVGWYMAHYVPRGDPLKDTLTGLHKSFGVLVLILFFVRVAIRIKSKIPPLPSGIPLLEQKLAHLGHMALYFFIFIVPLSGYAMSNMYGFNVKMFGIEMPKIFPADRAMGALARETHGILPYILLGIIALHVAAVIQHRFFEKPENDVLGRML